MAMARELATATLLPDGRVLVAQGTVGVNQFAELYDPRSGKFERTGKETAFENPTATLLPNGKVLVTGYRGYQGVGLGIGAEVFDGATAKFTLASIGPAIGAMPTVQYKGEPVERVGGLGLLLKDGRVLLFQAGYLETYDPATGTCANAGFISPAGQWLGPTATLLPDGRVLFVGGDLTTDPVTSDDVITNIVVLYDPISGTSATGTIKTSRHYQTATLLPNGSVLIAGGEDNNGKPLASAELLRP
jgi:hypothetical protein